MNLRRFVLLDRDGTVNVERHYLASPEALELLPNALAGLRRLADLGLGLVVVSNQSGIARGYFDWPALTAIHERLRELLRQGGVELDGVYACPHVEEDNCVCRKPKPGMAERAASDLGFDLRTAFVIGDKASDIALGRRVGATTLLVRTGYGEKYADTANADFQVADLHEAAEVIATLVLKPGRKEWP